LKYIICETNSTKSRIVKIQKYLAGIIFCKLRRKQRSKRHWTDIETTLNIKIKKNAREV